MAGGDMARRIKELRKERNMTLEDVAKIVGVGKSTVRKWETGMIENMRRDKIAALAKALGTTPVALMGWIDEEEEKKNDILSDIILKMNEDAELFEMVVALSNLGFEKREAIKPVLFALQATDK